MPEPARASAAESAIAALQAHVSELADREIRRLRRRGGSTEADERALLGLASMLVHAPSVRGRALDERGRAGTFVAAVDTLYGLVPTADAADLDGVGAAGSAAPTG